MYQTFFHLHGPPFQNTPDVSRFYTGGSRGDVLQGLIYCLRSGAPIVKVVGEVGSGKTMLCRVVQMHLPDHIHSVYLLNPNLPPRFVYHAIGAELGLPVSKYNKLELQHAIYRRLLVMHERGLRVVVIIDEAQSMPVATLEEIRLMTNLETSSAKLLQIILLGQPELEQVLAQNHIRQLRERIQYSFYLKPLNRNEIMEYLMLRLRLAGHCGQPLFSSAACSLITRYSMGLIRRVNILAEKSLLAAYCQGSEKIQKRHVNQAYLESAFAKRPRRFWSWLPSSRSGISY